MIRFFQYIFVCVCFLTLASAEASTSEYWEGMIEDPQAPRLMQLTFNEEKGAYQGTLDVFGARGLVLEDVRIQTGSARFKLKIDTTTLVFEAKITGNHMQGTVSDGESDTPFNLQRFPPLSPPQNRVEAWSQDLDFVVERFLKYDRSFSSQTRDQFRRAIFEIKSSIKDRTDSQMIVALARAVALSKNAHTRLYLLRNRTELRRLPLRLWWFQDGLYVVRATAQNQNALGCKVTQIGGKKVEDVYQQVTSIFAGNESWQKYMSVYSLTSPEILSGIGTIQDMENIRFDLECHGNPTSMIVKPLPLEKSVKPLEAWWDLSPFSKHQNPDWLSALDPNRAPLFLKHPQQYYWFEYLEDKNVLYFQYNRSQNMPEGENFVDFSKRLQTVIRDKLIRAMIIDLRLNTGGDNGIAKEFFRSLARIEKVNQKGKLFAIIGRNTFSAGITHAVELKQFTSAIFVGEPIGDHLDMWSEGGNLVLPNSKLTIHFANGYHNYSKSNPPEPKTYFQNLDVDDLKPDILVSGSFEEYLSGRDPVVEKVLSLINKVQ